MKLTKSIIGPTLVALGMAAGNAYGASVTLSNENSSDSGTELFDHTNNSVVAVDDDTVHVVLGLDGFSASSAALTEPGSRLDTSSMIITPDAGYRITSVRYVEEGNWSVNNGIVIGDGSLVVNGIGADLGSTFVVAQTGSASGDFGFDITIGGLTAEVVDVSATNSLTAAVIAAASSSAEINKTSAYMEVELAPIPIPPAVWMLGSALVGLATVRRKNAA